MKSVILIFIDGLGLGSKDQKINPCLNHKLNLFACYDTHQDIIRIENNGYCRPTDTTLGIKGLPQSATGTATILTGINCPEILNRHKPGFPNKILRSILTEHSILKKIKDKGYTSTFLNAFRPLFFKLDEKMKWLLSATTTANLAAKNPFYTIDDIANRISVYHDYTNSRLIKRGFNIPLFSHHEAAEIIAHASNKFNFVLYEFFLTDHIGHKQNMEKAVDILISLENLVKSLITKIDLDNTLLIITSDHGNIEDISVKTHTRNKVGTYLWGRESDKLVYRINSLTDISKIILDYL